MGKLEEHTRPTVHAKRGPKPKHDWPTHLVVWLHDLARTDPWRLHSTSVSKLAEAAHDHLRETVGWAPADRRRLEDAIAEWMRARSPDLRRH
jgi:hypothetical protein